MNEKVYDIAIIGGGIAGAGIARDAALRGESVALFEKNYFAAGASSKSSKLIHGGLRYLEIAWKRLLRFDLIGAWQNFRFVFVSLRECRLLEEMAPTLIQPAPILIPLYHSSHRNRWSVYLGCKLYGFLAFLAGSKRFPEILNADEVLQKFPDIRKEGLLGGAIVWDRMTDDKRLVEALLRSALKKGALALEGAEITGYTHDKNTKNYRLTVRQGDEQKEFYSKHLVNATGAWADQTRNLSGEKHNPMIYPVAGAHIMLPRFLPFSMLAEAKDGRPFFVIDWNGFSRVGTTERTVENLDQVQATAEEKKYLLESLSFYFPSKNFSEDSILSSDAGVRPLALETKNLNANQVSREHKIFTGEDGVLHVIGVKLTDHRRAAEDVVNKLSTRKSRTRLEPLL